MAELAVPNARKGVAVIIILKLAGRVDVTRAKTVEEASVGAEEIIFKTSHTIAGVFT